MNRWIIFFETDLCGITRLFNNTIFFRKFVETKYIKQCNIKKLIVINKISLLITYVYINYCIQKSCNFYWTSFSIFFTYNIAILFFIHLLSKNILRLLTFLKISSLTILHNYKSIEIFLYRNVTKLYLYWTSHYLIICLAFFLLEYIEEICWIFARQFGKTLIVYNLKKKNIYIYIYIYVTFILKNFSNFYEYKNLYI